MRSYPLAVVRKAVIDSLIVGQTYKLSTVESEDARKRKVAKEMVFVKAYENVALFETSSGERRCFQYQEIFFQMMEWKKRAKK